MVGVPAPAPSTGGGTFDPGLPLVPTPTDFVAKLEDDGSLTLRWKPSRDASGEPFATLLYIDGIATQTLAPGETQVNLGPFDPADMRVFTIVAVDGDGKASPASAGLRSTSLLAGKTLDEARAILADRGFAVGIVRGTGTIVVAPAAALMAPLGSKIDLELGTPTHAGPARLRRRHDEALRPGREQVDRAAAQDDACCHGHDDAARPDAASARTAGASPPRQE